MEGRRALLRLPTVAVAVSLASLVTRTRGTTAKIEGGAIIAHQKICLEQQDLTGRAMVSLMGWQEDSSMVLAIAMASLTTKGAILYTEMHVELAALESGVIFMAPSEVATNQRDQQIQKLASVWNNFLMQN